MRSLGSGSGEFNATTFEDNFTLSCAASSIEDLSLQPYSYVLLTIVRVLQFLYWLLLFFVGSFLNGFVIFLVVRYKSLQTISFTIALQIAIKNVLLASTNIYALVSVVANKWVFGEHMCSLSGAIFIAAALVRTSLLLAFVLDRFFLVFLPFSYPKHQKKAVVIFSMISWLNPILVSMFGYVIDCYTFMVNLLKCSFDTSCHYICSVISALGHISVTIPGGVLPFFLYAALFIKAHKAKKAMISPETLPSARNPKPDLKTTFTFFILFVTTFALLVPNLAITGIIVELYGGRRVPSSFYIIDIASASALNFLLVTDPLFIMRHRDVSEVIKAIKLKLKGGTAGTPRQEAIEMKTVEVNKSKNDN